MKEKIPNCIEGNLQELEFELRLKMAETGKHYFLVSKYL